MQVSISTQFMEHYYKVIGRKERMKVKFNCKLKILYNTLNINYHTNKDYKVQNLTSN